MGETLRKNITLLTEIHTKQKLIASVFSHLRIPTKDSKNLVASKTEGNLNADLFSIKKVPEYFETEIRDSNQWRIKKFPSVKGYAIQLDDATSADHYLRQHNKKQRENTKRLLRRLENCFQISYELYYGSISEDMYRKLMERLKLMILKRFEQRAEISESIKIWNHVLSTSFNLINQKKASLFVIYDDQLPIAISLNYHYDQILFGYISSYDIDYYKFGLGNLLIYKQLDWCIENGYNHFDMGWGDLKYKKWWSNNIYQFNHHIVFPKNSPLALFWTFWNGNKTAIIAFLISKGVNKYSRKIKNLLFQRKKPQRKPPQYYFENLNSWSKEELNLKELKPGEELIPKSSRNDFLFLTKEKSNNVSVYCLPEKDKYVLKGSHSLKVLVLNTPQH